VYAVILRYKRPLAEVDKHAEAHRAWLRKQYAAGHFLVSGPQQPRTGGFILARAESKAAVEAILAGDPFNSEQIADYEIIEFLPFMTAPELAGLGVS
jgi:uncharacterized protein YciI